jgi:hypothetical protein
MRIWDFSMAVLVVLRKEHQIEVGYGAFQTTKDGSIQP